MLTFFIFSSVKAQNKGEIQVLPKTSPESIKKTCKSLTLGKILENPKPDYPPEARNALVGGTVEIGVKIDEKGKVLEVEKVSGNSILQGSAIASALKAKFSPTICDGVQARISGVIVYNFIPGVFGETYFTPTKIEDFSDVSTNSETFETILDLTENYKLSFGYADKKFHADAPLTRGDFAHFLRLTLDLLNDRAKVAGKIPRDINLFSASNPQKIDSADKITDLEPKFPFTESIKILLLKYDIAFLSQPNKFQGNLPMSNNEVIELWTTIFGTETIPVNFEKIPNNERIITRGEFALFLQESLRVLTYKVLP